MGKLYVVATPIGNLGDLSPRAVSTLKEVDLIAAEDTRVTMKLCQVFDIHTRLISCYQYNENDKGKQIAERIATEGISVAITTDAGTPCVSDPGYGVVKACIEKGIDVVPVPGCSASIAALSICGLDTRQFAFYGFLPRNKKELSEKLLSISQGVKIAVIHESPHRILDLLRTIAQILPQTYVVTCCDLTKLHEKITRGNVNNVIQLLANDPKVEKGEYCIVLDFGDVQLNSESTTREKDISIEACLIQQMKNGCGLREAQNRLIENGFKKNAVKQAALNLKKMIQ